MAGRLRIVHLYPNELNLYGDSGNVLCIKRRLDLRNIKYEIIPVGCGDTLCDFDLMIIGGGQDREMLSILSDLKRKAEMIAYSVNIGKTVFAVCGGFQLLGEYYKSADASFMKMTGALPFYTVSERPRMIGNLVFETPFGTAAGFENHSGRTYLSDGLSPLGKVISGFGNNGEDSGEGLFYKNTFATYAHGPLLPKNPNLADELIKRALGCDGLKELDDSLENRCRLSLIRKFS